MGKRGGGERYDWDAIREEYITTDQSTAAIAEKYGIRKKTVEIKCAKGGWVAARREYKQKVTERVVEKVTEKTADSRSDILARVLLSADISSQKIADILMSGKPLKATEMEHYVNCLEAIERMARNIQGILTIAQERKLKIEEERLELEKKKASQSTPDKDIVIRIEGYKDEWAE